MVGAQKYRAYLPVLGVLTIALLIGIFTLKDYGESWDEADIYRYSNYSLSAYKYFFHPGQLEPFDTNLNLYGPAYYMATNAAARLISRLIPPWSQVDAWHFTYFLSFLGGALSIFFLSRRWAAPAGSLGATVLFLSQPLLWGHSFINPKDIPFMCTFSASILTGFVITDRFWMRKSLDLTILPASILLGITSSFRVAGPLAGLIVLGYAMFRLGRRALGLAIPYVALAAITAYLTWPYLWWSLIPHYIESLQTMSQFPFATLILYEGQLYKASQLPRSYFPTLLILQLTESALIVIAAGIVIAVVRLLKDGVWQPVGLFFAWFLIPMLVIIGFGSPIYDNGRQLYFLLPPLFILGGIALDRLFMIAVHPALQAAAMLLIALPGIVVGARLHPYEYVYYNALVGGTGGAFRRFEMDYWGTSLKDLSEYMNATVPPNSRVLVFGPEQIVARYARPDIQVSIAGELTHTSYDYAILLTREDLDERACRKAETVYEVGRRGAVFAVMRRIAGGVQCP